MRVFRDEQTYTTKLVDITCDVCGGSCRDKLDMNFELVTVSGNWGYGSLKDGTSWKCEICEDCADKVRQFIESIGGKVIITTYI